jgi:hypothetical protein
MAQYNPNSRTEALTELLMRDEVAGFRSNFQSDVHLPKLAVVDSIDIFRFEP